MGIRGLGHVNLRADADMIERLRHFYTDAIGLVEGPRPGFGPESRGYWLYAGATAIVHLSIGNEGDTPLATGHFNHFAFDCDNLEATRAHLDAAGVAYTVKVIAARQQTQLFLRDPAGVRVELTFTTV